MSDISTKNIILGVIFWLIMIAAILLLMRSCAQQQVLEQESNSTAPMTSVLYWYVQMKHDPITFTRLKRTGYNTQLFYTYLNNERIVHLRVGPYDTRGQAKAVMQQISQMFDTALQIISALSDKDSHDE